MNDTPNNNRGPDKISPEDAKAMLGLTNHISELAHGIQPQAMQPPVEAPQMTPGGAEAAKPAQPFDNTKNEAKMTEIEAAMEQMKSEMEITIKDEIASIKDLIIESLKDDGQK